MPEDKRVPYKLVARGVGLRNPVDLLPEGLYPSLTNMVSNEHGTLGVRNQITRIASYPGSVHSIRRLNDPVGSTFIRLTGSGTDLYADNTLIDSGYSGLPLAMVPLRPPRSPRPWMYISDASRSRKVSPASVDYPMGIAPPSVPINASIGQPNTLVLSNLESVTDVPAGWANWGIAGTSTGIGANVRFNETITAILYDSGSTGNCSIIPSAINDNYQAGALCILTHAATPETVKIRGVFRAMASTTVSSIIYDSGTSGPCSIVPITSEGIERDTIVQLGGTSEYVRILSVTEGVDGQRSFRCSTVNTHAAADTITGQSSFRVYTTATYAAADTITGNGLPVTVTSGKGWMYTSGAEKNFGTSGGRSIQPDDFIHISFKANDPSLIKSLRVYINIDSSFPTFPNIVNAFYKDIVPSDVFQTYTEFTFKVSELVRIGHGQTRSLQTVTGLTIEVESSGTVVVYADSWWIGGTYGPDSSTGLGYTYYQRYRAKDTGAKSNPSPPTRYALDLRREKATLTPVASSDGQVDVIDIFRVGGNLLVPRLVASLPNTATPFADIASDASAAVNETLDFDRFQPFPVSDLPKSGTCKVTGTTIERLTGDTFNTSWQAGSQIIIGGNVYTLYAPPISTSRLELVENAGSSASAMFDIPEATIGGRPVPAMWGPDPLTNVLFGCGMPYAAGTLFWTNPDDPDSASDANQLEVTSPSEPLMNGFIYDGRSYVFSSERLFLCYAQQIRQLDGSTRLTYAAQEVPNLKGLYCRYGMAVGDKFWGVTKEGIFEGPDSITDDLYPLFPHQNQVGVTKNGYLPMDFTRVNDIRLFYTHKCLYFIYTDTGGDRQVWFRDRSLPQPGWFHLHFVVTPNVIYDEEGAGVNSILMGAGGPDIDDSIAFDFTTPAYDLNDPRLQKLFLDPMVDLDQDGVNMDVYLLFDNLTVPTGSFFQTGTVGRKQIQLNAITPGLNRGLVLYRNVALKVSGVRLLTTPTTPSPKFYEFEPHAVMEPYLATVMSSAHNVSHGFTTYGHIRDGYFVWISTATIAVTITADGTRTYTFTLPSSSGSIKKQYFPFGALKGLMFYYYAASSTPFTLFTAETVVRVKEWGSSGPYQAFQPFAGQSR